MKEMGRCDDGECWGGCNRTRARARAPHNQKHCATPNTAERLWESVPLKVAVQREMRSVDVRIHGEAEHKMTESCAPGDATLSEKASCEATQVSTMNAEASKALSTPAQPLVQSAPPCKPRTRPRRVPHRRPSTQLPLWSAPMRSTLPFATKQHAKGAHTPSQRRFRTRWRASGLASRR